MSATTRTSAGRIALAPLQERAEQLARWGETTTIWCERIGWLDARGNADTSRFDRALGRRPTQISRKWVPKFGEYRTYGGNVQTRVNEATALVLAKALDLDPWEIGL